MTRERFEDLAEIYGGDIARWPAAERDAAALLMAAEPEFAKAALAAPADLDAVLDAWAPMAVSHQLRGAGSGAPGWGLDWRRPAPPAWSSG